MQDKQNNKTFPWKISHRLEKNTMHLYDKGIVSEYELSQLYNRRQMTQFKMGKRCTLLTEEKGTH